MHKKKLIIIFLAICAFGFSQENKSIHQIEWEKHRYLKSGDENIDIVDNTIIPLQTFKTAVLSKKVFGFLPDWEYLADAMDNIQFDLLTHIAAFDFNVSSDGSISNPAGWPWTDLINQAHSNGVKVILTAVNFNGDQIHTIITDGPIKSNFVSNLINKINLYSLDGVNIDFESLNNADKGSIINSFMTELTDSIHSNFPEAEVSFDGPAVNWGGHWDFAGLANACDYIFIMGYAFSGSWSTNAASTAPLTGGTYNITNTVQSQYSSVVNSTPNKLILGVPYYGEKFQTDNNQAHSTVISYVGSTRFRNSKSESATHGELWDSGTSSPWYVYQSDDLWFQAWADNAQSIDEKFDLADSRSLLGVGMWALNYDGNQNDLWNVIIDHYSDSNPIPGEPLNFNLTSFDQSSLKVDFSDVEFASGYWVYYGTDGLTFTDSAYFNASDSILSGLGSDALYFVKIRALGGSGIGPATGVLAATTNLADQSPALIVDGFDRQSGTTNSRDYIRMHAVTLFNLGINFSSATNEAVTSNGINIEDYLLVDWMLGDESTVDETFNSVEQIIVMGFLQQGGKLFVSGSEVGWDLGRNSGSDQDFYNNFLKAEYIADAPNGRQGEYYSAEAIPGHLFDGLAGFSFNSLYDVDWPDAINGVNGASNILQYTDAPSSNIAGIVYEGMFPEGDEEGKLVYFGFPFETIHPQQSRDSVMSYVIDFFEGIISKIPEINLLPQKSVLYQNYPNPFNPATKIRFYLDKPGNVSVQIYDITGKEIVSLRKGFSNTGLHVVEFNGSNYASGIYIYEVSFGQQRLRKKMMLVK